MTVTYLFVAAKPPYTQSEAWSEDERQYHDPDDRCDEDASNIKFAASGLITGWRSTRDEVRGEQSRQK